MEEDVTYSKIVDKNLKNSIVEGACNSCKTGFGESYISAFAIKIMNASNFEIALLSSIPRFIGFLSNLLSIPMLERIKNRKKMILLGVFISALMLIPIFLSSFVPNLDAWLLIFFTTIYFLSDFIIAPIWISLIGDIVPDKIKGNYFGKRNKYLGLAEFVSYLIGGIILSYFANVNLLIGFGIIFGLALLFRLMSFFFISKLYEPDYVIEEQNRFSFIDFLKRLGSTNYGLFVVYICVFTFAVQTVAPFFVVYMLRDLKFDFITFTIVSVGATVSGFLTMSIWGKYSDEFGNKKILSITGILISFIPILWTLSKNPIYLFSVETFSGFLWAGFSLSSFNFVFDTVSPEKRIRAVSYYRVLYGTSILLGALFGGVLLNFNTTFWSSVILVMLISAALRLLSSLIILPKIKEVKPVKNISGAQLFWSIITVESIKGLNQPIILVKRNAKKPKEFIDKIVDELKEVIKRTKE